MAVLLSTVVLELVIYLDGVYTVSYTVLKKIIGMKVKNSPSMPQFTYYPIYSGTKDKGLLFNATCFLSYSNYARQD